MENITVKIAGFEHVNFLVKYFENLNEAIKQMVFKSQKGTINNIEKITHLIHAESILQKLKIKQIENKAVFTLKLLPVEALLILKYGDMINESFSAFTPDINIKIIELNEKLYNQLININTLK